MKIHPLAGQKPQPSMLVNISKLIDAYYSEIPDPSIPAQKVAFGTSGHRGSSFDKSFNERHILAITQAICLYRAKNGIDGPLYLGIDTHALSVPAMHTAVEVLAANDVHVMLAENDEFTPTPVISHAILTYNKGRKNHLADGIVVTPSHNPPNDGGFKYNPPSGGPADTTTTQWIQTKANEFLANGMSGVRRIPFPQAVKASNITRHNYIDTYIEDLSNVIDMEIIKNSSFRFGVDPLGGAGVHYWKKIADRYGIDLNIISEVIDPQFAFMTLDWDGQIRMDPSSQYAMQRLIQSKDHYDLCFACDTDHDRHGVVTKAGLMPANHYLAAAAYYLFKHRPLWPSHAGIGKTVVTTWMLDRVAKALKHQLYEVPVGFKYFVDQLLSGQLTFVCEESAGATFARIDGSVWTTDKDGMIAGLLAAEMTSRLGKDPADIYNSLTQEFGTLYSERVDAAASSAQKERLKRITPEQITLTDLAGDKITSIITHAPGNHDAIGGIKVSSTTGWFAARPSGTEDIYKIYGESTVSQDHLDNIIAEGQSIVNNAIAS